MLSVHCANLLCFDMPACIIYIFTPRIQGEAKSDLHDLIKSERTSIAFYSVARDERSSSEFYL